MPSIATQIKNFEDAKAAQAIVPAPVNSANVPIPVADYPVNQAPYLRTPLPAASVQQPDMQRVWQAGTSPQSRISPLPPISNPVANASAASQSIVITRTSGILLKTNNQPNTKQDVLNLIAGTGVTLSADGQGGVTIVGSGGSTGDGLIHGDAIWETDSAYIRLRDEFISATGNVTGNGIGELGWQLSGNTGAFQISENHMGLHPLHLGEFTWTNSTTNNSTATQGIGNISLAVTGFGSGSDTEITAWPVLAFPSWKATFVWRFHRPGEIPANNAPNFGKKSIYIGLGNDVLPPQLGWTRPSIFIGARYDTDPTAPAISDSTIKLEAVQNSLPTGNTITRNNTQGTTFDTGITPVEDVYYRLDILCTAAGTVQMAINSATLHSFTLPKFVVTAGSASTAVRANNGEALLQFGTTGGNQVSHPFGPGTPVTVAGTGTILDGTFNTNQTFIGTQANDRISYLFGSTVALATPTGYTVTGYAGLLPIVMFGNDSQAAPATDNRVCVDYFSFVWNPGVGGGTGTADPTKSRYFI
jgi:hypothetical protein